MTAKADSSEQSFYRFEVNHTKGFVSALRQTASHPPVARVLLAHGAGANMQHVHMQSLADALSNQGIESLRYQFPYMESGGGRVDSLDNCLDTIAGALNLSNTLPSLPTFIAGHSFGGRMSSHFVSACRLGTYANEALAINPADFISGAVYFSFPLHPSKKPSTTRALHLHTITHPQLFVSGNRDSLAELELLETVVNDVNAAQLHIIDTADHGFKTLKRTRVSKLTAYDEAAEVVSKFISHLV